MVPELGKRDPEDFLNLNAVARHEGTRGSAETIGAMR